MKEQARRTDSELLAEVATCLGQLREPDSRLAVARGGVDSLDAQQRLRLIGELISGIADDAAVLEVIEACLDQLNDERLRLLDGRRQLELALAGLHAGGRLEIWQRRLLAGIDQGRVAWVEHQTSTATWLAEAANLTSKQAAQLIRAGAELEKFSTVGEAASRGQVLPAQAQAITQVLSELPVELPADATAAGQRLMVEFAASHNSAELRRLTAHLVEVLAPESADELEAKRLERAERRAQLRRNLEFWGDGDGSVLFRGSLPLVQAEPFIQIIDSYVAAQTRALDDVDPREPLKSPGRRRADALVRMIERHLQDCLAPGNGGDRPRVIVTMSYDRLQQRCLEAGLGVAVAGPLGGAAFDPTCPDPGTFDPGTFDPGAFDPGAFDPTVASVRMPTAHLTRSGVPLSAGALRQLLCDADLMPMVLGGESQILDVGRAQRLVTPAIRAALEIRDGGCVFPGCDKPPQACQAHHILPWWAGGRTSLANLVLVCPHHHGIVEPSHDPPADRWRVRLAKDGLAQVIPPQRVDPTQRPRRNARLLPAGCT